MKKTTLLSLVTVTSLMASDFGIEIGAQKNKLDADIAYGNAVTRTTVTENELGLKNSDTNVKPRLYYTTENHTFDLDFQSMDFSGSNTLTRTIVFDNRTYTANATVNSTLELDWYRFGYRYSVINDNNTKLSIGADINIIDTDIGLNAPSLNLSSSYSETIPLPTLVIEGNYAINDMFGIEAKAAGITAGSKAKYTEFYAGININCLLIENGQWRLGYQSKKFEVDIDDFDGELSFNGAYLGFNYKF